MIILDLDFYQVGIHLRDLNDDSENYKDRKQKEEGYLEDHQIKI